MDADEIKAICKQVLADRKRKKAPLAGCSQGGVEADDAALAKELIAARKTIAKKEMPKDSCIKFFGG